MDELKVRSMIYTKGVKWTDNFFFFFEHWLRLKIYDGKNFLRGGLLLETEISSILSVPY